VDKPAIKRSVLASSGRSFPNRLHSEYTAGSNAHPAAPAVFYSSGAKKAVVHDFDIATNTTAI